MRNLKYISILFSTYFILNSTLGCSKVADGTAPGATDVTPPATSPTDGSQSAAELAGTGTFCATNTTIGGTYAYVYNLTLNADGTYGYNIYFSDATSCATAQNSGGNNYATYSQSGTFVVGGTAGTPSTATKITLTVTTAQLIIRSLTFGAIPQNLANWMSTGGALRAQSGFFNFS